MRPGSSVVAEEPRKAADTASLAAWAELWPAPALAFVSVALLAADPGGVFAPAWGWGAAGLLIPIVAWLFAGGRSEVGRRDAWLVAAFAALTAWVALSTIWSDAPARSVLESGRWLVYLAGLAGIALLARRASLPALVGAVWAAVLVVDIYSLCTRLFPNRLGAYDPVSTYRLSDPIGYWNGLGLFTVVGALLAVGIAARGRNAVVRIVAGTSLVVLLPVFYFTFSRASWVVLAVGVVVAIAYDPRRLQLIAWLLLLAPAPAIASLLAARSNGLTHAQRPLAEAVHDGHRLAFAVLLLLALAALSVFAGLKLERRVDPTRRLRVAFGGAVALAAAVVVLLGLVRVGGPVRAVERAYDSFRAPPGTTGANLNQRLLSLSSNGRTELWHVAWRDYRGHELLGSGAGTFDRYWFRDRKTNFNAHDAHSAYIEILAELGPLGLVLLIVAVALPFTALRRARGHPLVPLVLGAYVAFLVHAGVDWDLELPGVSLAGLLCGLALIVAARDSRPRLFSGSVRAGAGALAICLLAFALWGLLANSALSSSKDARSRGDVAKAVRDAKRGRQLMPWSPEPWQALGFAQSAGGDRQAAALSFRRAIEKDAGDWTSWLDLAAVTKGKERRIALARARALNPLSFEIGSLSSRSG